MRIKIAIIGLLAIAFTALTGCTPSGLMNEQLFTRVYRDSLEKRWPQAEFRIDAPLEVTGSLDGQDYQHFLDNAYAAYRNEPDSIVTIFQNYLAPSIAFYSGVEHKLQADHIVPVIKGKDFLDGLPDGAQETLVYERYNDELIICYVEDTETGMRYLNETHLEEAGIHTDTLRPFAVRNLIGLLPEIQLYGEGTAYFGIGAGGYYESSLILFDRIWSQENFPVSGDFVVIIPNRDIVAVAGSNDAASIESLREIARKSYADGPYTVSPHLFRWNGKTFERYE